jgi:hypothetical protein
VRQVPQGRRRHVHHLRQGRALLHERERDVGEPVHVRRQQRGVVLDEPGHIGESLGQQLHRGGEVLPLPGQQVRDRRHVVVELSDLRVDRREGRGEGLQVVEGGEEIVPVGREGLHGLGEAGERPVQRLAVAVEVGGTDVDEVRQRTVLVGTAGPERRRQLVQRPVDLVELHRGGRPVQRNLVAVLHRRAAVIGR